MTTATLKLTKGARLIDLMSGPFSVGNDFKPPATAYNIGLAAGGSSNITGGATVYTRKYINQDFEFQIAISATNDLGVRGSLQSLTTLLMQAGDEREPLYLEYKPNSDTAEPLWGQNGANYRYEVVSGTLSGLWDMYGATTLRARLVFVTVRLTIKPFALGATQQLVTATGGVIENTIGQPDGNSLGLYIPASTINLFTNPVFSASAFSDLWQTCAALGGIGGVNAASQIDPTFIFPGTKTSALVYTACTTGNTYTQQVTAANTNTHTISAYARRNDGGAVSASQCSLWYAASLLTTYTLINNGWYRLTASRAGIASACAAGIMIQPNQSLTVTGFQLEGLPYATPLAYGDLLGCTWSSSPHNSTTTRATASGKLQIDNTTLNALQGSVRVAFQPDNYLDSTSTFYLLDCRDGTSATALRAYYQVSNGFFTVQHGGITLQSAAYSSTAMSIIHITWGAAGVFLYLNGSLSASAAFAYAQFGANLFIGSDFNSANQSTASFSLATFDRALSSTEITNDYANLAALISDGRGIEALPYFWTFSGDNILSLDTGKQPRGVVGGVGGDAPAITEMHGTLSSNWSTIGSLALSNFDTPYHIPWGYFFADQSGTASATDYGGQHKSTTLSTCLLKSSFTDATSTASLPAHLTNILDDREIYLLHRIRSASNVTTGCAINLYGSFLFGNSTCNIFSDSRSVSLGANYRTMRTPPFKLPKADSFWGVTKGNLYITPAAALPTASAATIEVDYYTVMPRPMLVLSSLRSNTRFVYRQMTAYNRHATQNVLTDVMTVTGDVIEFVPRRYNLFQCIFGGDETVDPLTTYQLNLTAIYITPRWMLL